MNNLEMGEAMQDVAHEMPKNEQPECGKYGLRLNFNGGAKMMFEFPDNGNPLDIAKEINGFMQNKVELLDLRDDATFDKEGKAVIGKRYFRASDILPKRKATIDIIHNGSLVKAGIMGVACQPAMIFNNQGKFFKELVTVLLRQTNKALAEKSQVKYIG